MDSKKFNLAISQCLNESAETPVDEKECVLCIKGKGKELAEYAYFRNLEQAKKVCDAQNKHSKRHAGCFVVLTPDHSEQLYPEVAINENEEPDYEKYDDYEEFIDQAKDGAFDGYRIITASIEDGWGGLRLLLKDEDNNLSEVFVKNHNLKDADAWLADCGRRNIDGVITHTDELPVNESTDEMCEITVSPHLHLDVQSILNANDEIKKEIEWTSANSFKFKKDEKLLDRIMDTLKAGGVPEEEILPHELDEASASKKVNEAEEEGDLQKLNKFLNDYFQIEFKFEGRWGKQIEFDTESTLRYRGIDAEDLSNKAAEAMGEKIDPDSISVQKNSVTIIVTEKFDDGMGRFDLSTITKENMPEILKFDELKKLIEDEFGYKVAVLAVNDKKFEFESDNIKAEAGILKGIFRDLRISSSSSLITTNPKTGKLNAYAGVNFAWEFADHGFNGHSIGSVKFEDGKWILKRY